MALGLTAGELVSIDLFAGLELAMTEWFSPVELATTDVLGMAAGEAAAAGSALATMSEITAAVVRHSWLPTVITRR